ncbi:MAG TPA: hypothetical protein VFG13_06125 [Blastococcus sp.]|nr:hypothetical protein [Blastococcus sp.]
MTRTDEPLAIRPPAWVRVLGPLFLAGWLSVLLLRPGGVPVPGVVIALLAAAVVGRLFFTSAIGTADGRLTVRNVWSTRTFHRVDIRSAGVDRAARRGGRGWAVWLLLEDGARHRLDVTEVPFLGPSSATLERQAAAIRAWLDGRGGAFL